MTEHEMRLQECFALLERNRDPSFCKVLYPDLADEIDHFVRSQRLLADAVPSPDEAAVIGARNHLLAAVGTQPVQAERRSLLGLGRWAALGIAGGLLLTASIGASAAGLNGQGPKNQVLTALGLGGTAPVETAVLTAVESPTPGAGSSFAMSIVSCIARAGQSEATSEDEDAAEPADEEDTNGCFEFEGSFESWEGLSLPEGFEGAVPGLEGIRATIEAMCERMREVLPEGRPEPRICQPDAEFWPSALTGDLDIASIPTLDLDEQLDGVKEQIDAGLERARAATAEACERVAELLPEGMQLPAICELDGEGFDLSGGFDIEQMLEDLKNSLGGLESTGAGTLPGLEGLNDARNGACDRMLESMPVIARLQELCESLGSDGTQ